MNPLLKLINCFQAFIWETGYANITISLKDKRVRGFIFIFINFLELHLTVTLK